VTRRFPLIVDALARLRSRSCIIDGEAVACDDNGLASFERIPYRQHDGDVFLYAFDLIELNGDDLRRDPLQVRKATLASILAKAGPGIQFNEHIEGDACKMGLECIVSKHNQRAMSKPTVTLTRNVSSPLEIGTGAAIAADAPCARVGTGGANPESSVIHSTRPSWMPDACA
jgi:bifunctional non-homologous end joining protein LigD